MRKTLNKEYEINKRNWASLKQANMAKLENYTLYARATTNDYIRKNPFEKTLKLADWGENEQQHGKKDKSTKINLLGSFYN